MKAARRCPTCRQWWSKNHWSPLCKTCVAHQRALLAAKDEEAKERAAWLALPRCGYCAQKYAGSLDEHMKGCSYPRSLR